MLDAVCVSMHSKIKTAKLITCQGVGPTLKNYRRRSVRFHYPIDDLFELLACPRKSILTHWLKHASETVIRDAILQRHVNRISLPLVPPQILLRPRSRKILPKFMK